MAFVFSSFRSTCSLILLLSINVAAAATEYDRLFSNPQQRAELDSLRQNSFRSENTRTEDTSNKTNSHKSQTPITVRGIVIRSSGPTSIWTNNSGVKLPPQISERQNTTNRRQTPRVHLYIGGHGTPVEMKPGQSYLPFSSRVIENYHLSNEHEKETIPIADVNNTASTKAGDKNGQQSP